MTAMQSIDPASGAILWEGAAATAAECRDAVATARRALASWSALDLGERRATLRRYQDELRARAERIASDISRETGKPLWEARTEVATMIGKIDLSIAAQDDRAGERRTAMPFGDAVLRHRPHGVMVVLGPYNFPGHLPNGHIVPALLAGDTVIFKPSELTPLVGTHIAECLAAAGLPDGVFTLIQGERDTGAALIDCDIDGLLFTGSSAAGMHFRKIMAERPKVMLALELGGNNPLVAWDGNPDAAAALIVQSAFITAGQRCTCARRLIVPDNKHGQQVVAAVRTLMDPRLWDRFRSASRAGVVNLNRPTTGASGALPFGGSGASGNHRPSAYYAADYCAYPVASLEAPTLADLLTDMRGLGQSLQLLHANAL